MNATPQESVRLARMRAALETRHKVVHAIRKFFDERGFLEVETPLRVAAPALEDHIDAEPSGDRYLRTSPELHMKRLLAAGYDRIYQVGPCFRRGERGDRHHPEYTMLEWYRAHANYADILADTKMLILAVAEEVAGTTDLRYQGREVSLGEAWERLYVRDAFLEHAGWDPMSAFDPERFDMDLVGKVEPALPGNVPVVLTDYPAERAALARLKEDEPAVAERWELYIAGLEIANAYSELADGDEQRKRFEACIEARRAAGREVYPMDEPFLDALAAGLPPSAGIALGVDRLVMIFADAATLDDVLPFRE